MGLYKRGATWWFSVMCNGKRIQHSTGTENKRLAETIYAKARIGTVEGSWFPETKQKKHFTFAELAEKYRHWMTGRQRSALTKGYRINQLVERFGNYDLERFNLILLESFQTERMQKGNGPRTINMFIVTIKAMFTKAADWGMADDEALKRVRKVKLLKGEQPRLRYLTKEECQALVNACDVQIRPIVITALNTGMRKSEILELKWDNVDLRHGFILLDKTKNGQRREVPINDTLKETLQGIVRRIDVPYVFFNPSTGKPYQKDLKRRFNGACIKVGIRDFRFHDLRHTFASQLVMAGVDITTVKELLGHKSLDMTLRYAHLSPTHKVKAIQLYDEVVNDKKSPLLQNCYNFATVG